MPNTTNATRRRQSRKPAPLPVPPKEGTPRKGNLILQSELGMHLMGLNFHAFAHCIALLLTRMGYEEVRLAGRTDFKGRNRHGGYDLEGTVPAAFALGSPRRIIVALKQFDDQMVFQKSIDELRGTCLRVGAHEALLITTGRFAPSVEQWYRSRPQPILAPVRLMDGLLLFNQLVAHGIGLCQTPERVASPGYTVDEAFFAELAQAHEGNGPGDRRSDHSRAKRDAPLRVTVEVERIGDQRRHQSGQLILDGWER
jgi:hypothetical protein